MRAAFVAPRLEVGGFERQWAHLVPGLAVRGVDFELFTLDGTGRFFDEIAASGVSARCLDLHGRFNVLGAIRAARIVAADAPDVIVTAGVSAHCVGELASHWADAAHVAAIHSAVGLSDTFTPRRKLIMRALAPHIQAYTAVTSAQTELLQTLGVASARTFVIPNGVPTPVVGRDRQDVRRDLGLDDGSFVALLVATLRPEKRLDRFAEAVAAARTHDPRIRGLIAGGGPGLDAARFSFEGRDDVLVLGPRSDIADLMGAADVVCLTSDAEALPLAVLEAMACGRPVVATDVGGMGDAVVDGETGFLVPVDGGVPPFADALVRLAADPALVTALGESGRERHAEHFSVERMVDAHYDLLRNVSGEAPSTARTGAARETTA